MVTNEIERLIRLHKTYADNLEWHLKTNSQYIQEDEREAINVRIADQNNFILELKNLQNVYKNEMALYIERLDAINDKFISSNQSF